MSAAASAATVASLLAVDPWGLGGACLHSQVHPIRDQWLRLLRELLPAGRPVRRIPCSISVERLSGSLDLAATLEACRPVVEPGILSAVEGGVLVIAMAERLSGHAAACIASGMDTVSAMPLFEAGRPRSSHFAVVAFDEGIEEESTPRVLLDRMAFLVTLEGISPRAVLVPPHDFADVRAAREMLPSVSLDDSLLTALCATAQALGAGSLRVSLLASRAARVAAALAGRRTCVEADVALAGSLVLAPRATRLPPPADEQRDAEGSSSDPQIGEDREPAEQGAARESDSALQERVIAAAQATIPPGLLSQLQTRREQRTRGSAAGRTGATTSGARGRPAGVLSGRPGRHARLNVIETLRAAAPWQRVRGGRTAGLSKLKITSSDFRSTRYRQHSATLTIFAVDASGSAALHRLAEAKGAVQILLADCYVRRDQVSVVGFRGRTCQLLLPPTRSLVRAKRSLAGLPGGGATPLASAIDVAFELATQARRRGESPTIVLLTDGRANIARDGTAGRERAQGDALRAAQKARGAQVPALFIDTSPRPNPTAALLASAMNARYLPLPQSNARVLSQVVKTLLPEARRP